MEANQDITTLIDNYRQSIHPPPVRSEEVQLKKYPVNIRKSSLQMNPGGS